MKHKRLILLVLVTLVSVISYAASQSLIVHLKSGDKLEILLSELPEITYENNDVIIRTNQDTYSYQFSDLEYLSFDDSSRIDVKCIDRQQHTIKVVDGMLLIDGISEISTIVISDIAGRIMSSKVVDSGSFVWDIPYNQTVVIVRINDVSFKIINL